MAQCLDLRKENPSRGDRFLIDTSAALYVVYPALSIDKGHQVRAEPYAEFLALCLRRGAEIFFSPLIVSEIAHVIERHLWQSFSPNEDLSMKAFRRLSEERKRVVAQIDAAWTQLRTFGSCISQVLDCDAIDRAAGRLRSTELDGYDLFYVDAMSTYKIPYIIADDGDYASVRDIIVYTANDRVIG